MMPFQGFGHTGAVPPDHVCHQVPLHGDPGFLGSMHTPSCKVSQSLHFQSQDINGLQNLFPL